MAKHKIITILRSSGQNIRFSSPEYSADGLTERNIIVEDDSTDLLINVPFVVSRVKSIVILSDKAMTLKTNDKITPSNTLSLVANQAYIWNLNSVTALTFTVDVIKIFATIGPVGNATLTVSVLEDTSGGANKQYNAVISSTAVITALLDVIP